MIVTNNSITVMSQSFTMITYQWLECWTWGLILNPFDSFCSFKIVKPKKPRSVVSLEVLLISFEFITSGCLLNINKILILSLIWRSLGVLILGKNVEAIISNLLLATISWVMSDHLVDILNILPILFLSLDQYFGDIFLTTQCQTFDLCPNS